ncbi:MAG TPA: hypothetical protein VK166_14355 [Chitinophagaceae bacterium]|nr:hypothetical protein [Chitinophagaceae bacterium]
MRWQKVCIRFNMALKGSKIEPVFTGMEIDESLDLHIKAWKLQPVAWTVIGIFVLAGLLGLFGSGVLSRSVVKQGTVTIEYERFYRYGTTVKLTIRDDSVGTQTEVGFPSAYISHFNITSVMPEPSRTEISGDKVSYIFKLGPRFRTMVFYLEPQDVGNASGLLSVNDAKIHLSHFIYP